MFIRTKRISVGEARQKVESGSALLVCAYDNDEKFHSMHLQGAISLDELRSRQESLPKDQEIIFYCA
jgi:rhodanese-related sulfurtransferase